MALDSGYFESSKNMTTDDVAALLVKLYSEYTISFGQNDDYAVAVATAIRMMTD